MSSTEEGRRQLDMLADKIDSGTTPLPSSCLVVTAFSPQCTRTLTAAIVLRLQYAMPGTDGAHAPTRLRVPVRLFRREALPRTGASQYNSACTTGYLTCEHGGYA